MKGMKLLALVVIVSLLAGCGSSSTALMIELTGTGTVNARYTKIEGGNGVTTAELPSKLPSSISAAASSTGDQVTVAAFLTTDGSITLTCKKDGETKGTAQSTTKLAVTSLSCAKE